MATNDRLSHILKHLYLDHIANVSLSKQSTVSKTTSKLTFVLITGCSRGIGYGLTEYLLTKRAKYYVIATCRSPNKASELQSLVTKYPNRSHVLKLDVTSEESVKNTLQKVLQITNKLDILINNAGIMNHFENVLRFNTKDMNKTLQTNVIGAALMFRTFHKLLKKNKNESASKVLNITSLLGSLKFAKWNNKMNRVPATTYRISKSALNMLTRCQAFQVGEKDNIIITTVHPGHVDTDLGTANKRVKAPVSLFESCEGIIIVMEQMNMEKHNGQFYTYQNKIAAW
eukprot:161960_1